MHYAMMIELDKCIGCQACVTSCKERWDTGPGAARNWVLNFSHGERDRDLGVTFYPGLCNHCGAHPCTEDCPTGATYATEEGIVVVDPDVCIGCGNCISKCPYGARSADARKGIVEKCDFCEAYIKRGQAPACVQTCLANCRHFGDLDHKSGELIELIQKRDARPLVTKTIDLKPRIYYAPPEQQQKILSQNVIRPYRSTTFTNIWQNVTAPLARFVVPPLVLLTGLAGILVNFKNRNPASEADHHNKKGETILRHRLGIRFLHWFNLASWILLLITGSALISNHRFALFGTRFPKMLIELVGSRASLLWTHVAWGVLWSVTIVPLFLYYKRGGLTALKEIRPTEDDLRWLIIKPLVMLGRVPSEKLPPQDKYNFGQKLFAISALIGTALIIFSGYILAFHWGSPAVVRASILVHKIVVMLALLGVAVHITMAAIIREERPALWSMVIGRIDHEHAEQHNTKWVQKLDNKGDDYKGEASADESEAKTRPPDADNSYREQTNKQANKGAWR